jgi:hypothetical protein
MQLLESLPEVFGRRREHDAVDGAEGDLTEASSFKPANPEHANYSPSFVGSGR